MAQKALPKKRQKEADLKCVMLELERQEGVKAELKLVKAELELTTAKLMRLNLNHGSHYSLFHSLDSLISGDISVLVSKISDYHKGKNFRSFMIYNKQIFQTSVDFLIPAKNLTSEVMLVMDGMKRKGDGKFGFIDTVVSGQNYEGIQLNVLLKLKHISLTGLYKGQNERSNLDFKFLLELNEDLIKETEEEILNRPYFIKSNIKKP